MHIYIPVVFTWVMYVFHSFKVSLNQCEHVIQLRPKCISSDINQLHKNLDLKQDEKHEIFLFSVFFFITIIYFLP